MNQPEPPQIELEPKDYRAKPIKGEPIFHKGGPKKVLLFFVMIGGMVALSSVLRPIVERVMAPVVVPAAKSFATMICGHPDC